MKLSTFDKRHFKNIPPVSNPSTAETESLGAFVDGCMDSLTAAEAVPFTDALTAYHVMDDAICDYTEKGYLAQLGINRFPRAKRQMPFADENGEAVLSEFNYFRTTDDLFTADHWQHLHNWNMHWENLTEARNNLMEQDALCGGFSGFGAFTRHLLLTIPAAAVAALFGWCLVGGLDAFLIASSHEDFLTNGLDTVSWIGLLLCSGLSVLGLCHCVISLFDAFQFRKDLAHFRQQYLATMIYIRLRIVWYRQSQRTAAIPRCYKDMLKQVHELCAPLSPYLEDI